MAPDDGSPDANTPPEPEKHAAEEPQRNELSRVTDSLEQLSFVDQNITDLKRELSSLDREESIEGSQGWPEKDQNAPERGCPDSDAESREEREPEGPTLSQAPAQEAPPEYLSYGLDGIFEAMRRHGPQRAPFLPTGKLDTESLRQKLLQENRQSGRFLEEDSVFYDRCTLNSSYGKTSPFRTANFAKLAPETFFYVFYNVTRDALQQMAANELFKRQWRFHQGSQLWFKQDAKKQTWLYFDTESWSTRSCGGPPEPEGSMLSKQEFDRLLEAEE